MWFSYPVPQPDSAVGAHHAVRAGTDAYWTHGVRIKGRTGTFKCLNGGPSPKGTILCFPEVR